MTPSDHALLLFRQLARWPVVTVLAGTSLLAICAYQDVEAGLAPALILLNSIGYLSDALLFKGLFLFGPYRPLRGETFSGSFFLIAVILGAFSLPGLIAAFAVFGSQIHETPPPWFFTVSTLLVVLACWVWIRLSNIKRLSS